MLLAPGKSPAGSQGRCNTIWYIAAFKGGVYETGETVWAFRGAEVRRLLGSEARQAARLNRVNHSSI